MFQRVLYGIAAIGVILTVVLADVLISVRVPSHAPLGALLERGSFIPLVLTVLALAGAWELRALLRVRGVRPAMPIALAAILLLMLSPWLSAAGYLGVRPDRVDGFVWQLIWLAVAMLATMIAQTARGDPEHAFRDVGATLLMITYCGLLPSFGVQMRCARDVVGQEGAWALLIVILVTKFSDIGGYLVGSTIGRHKLIPRVSAGKTVEGTLGGIAASVLLAVALIPISSAIYTAASRGAAQRGADISILVREICGLPARLGFSGAVILGATLAVVGLLGDLFESSLKRAAGRKDSGCLIPGYGGILDLTDSPWAALPVSWLLLREVLHVL